MTSNAVVSPGGAINVVYGGPCAITGTPTVTSAGMTFSGSQYINTGSDSLTAAGGITMVAYVEGGVANGSDNYALVRGNDATANSFGLDVVNGNAYLMSVGPTGGAQWAGGPINNTPGVWNQVVAVLNSSGAGVYINGTYYANISSASASDWTGTALATAPSVPLWVGAQNRTGYMDGYNGTLRNVAVYAGSLTPPQVNTSIAFSTLPTTAMAGGNSWNSIGLAQVEDGSGAAFNYNSTVNFTLTNTATNASSTTPVRANNGHARIPPITQAGTYVITATDLLGDTTTSGTVTITPANPSSLSFLQGPQRALPGTPMPQAVTVAVEDAYGNIVTADSSTVTLGLSSGSFAGGATTLTATAVNGIATFNALTMSVDGTFTLTASDGSLTRATSAPFTVSGYAVDSISMADGRSPQSGVVFDASGNLYGTTFSGGSAGLGTVFEIPSGSSTVTTLASFNGTNGADPYSPVTLDASGNLFGTTTAGGTNGAGTVFEIAAGSSTITTLASFNASNGTEPESSVTFDASGDLFGTTVVGGANDEGTVFEIAAGSSAITTLASFDDTNGARPYGALVFDAAGNLFGTTGYGGANYDGTVFEFAAGTSTLTTVASFDWTHGGTPNGLTVDTTGNLFGTTAGGGPNNNGTVFEIAKGGNAITTLAAFNGTNGAAPYDTVTIDAIGDLYGTTWGGGLSHDGTVFEIAKGTGAITTLATFTANNGQRPFASVIFDASGNLYGTTSAGGAGNKGTVFRLVPATHLTADPMPPSVVAGSPIGGTNGVRVTVEDANGSPADDDSTVTLTLTGGTFANGTTSISAVAAHGVATFQGLVIDTAGSYTLTASDGTLADANPQSFTVLPAAAQHLVFLQQPGRTFPHAIITPGIAVAVEDAYGNIVTGDSSPVTLTLSSNNFSTGLSTATTNAVNGIAKFPSLQLDVDGTFTVTASDGTLSPAVSLPFIVSGYGFDAISPPFIPNPQGAGPSGSLTFDAYGNLYGTTSSGGADGAGTVYKIAKGSHAITTIANFTGTNGRNPSGLVFDSTGNLYGTTSRGGAANVGTVFEIAAGSGAVTTVASFNGKDGKDPTSGVGFDANGNIYGATLQGGADGLGTVFEIAAGTSEITTLTTFDGSNGQLPFGGVTLDADGNLFGTMCNGGTGNDGTVFEVPKGSGSISVVTNFNGTNGAHPYGKLVLDANDNLYGTTYAGGVLNLGTVFEIAHGSSAVTTLTSFQGTDLDAPEPGLAIDTSGNLYGTTQDGGANRAGAAFEIASGSGSITVLAGFTTGNNGQLVGPAAAAVDPSGNLYGTAGAGGASGAGSIFEIAKGSGAITTIAEFLSTSGADPYGSLTPDASGNLFGTTEYGGPAGVGTVFEIPKGSSALTTLATFTVTNGARPEGTLGIDASGNLFGTTYQGGIDNCGTVFEIANGSKAITTVAAFDGMNWEEPTAGVVLDAAGNLYGTTFSGGAIFEIAKGSHTVTTLAPFNTATGTNPSGELTFDSAGNLYGTTSYNGANNDGAVFELPKGTATVTTIASFDGTNGANSAAGVTVDATGNLYGTTAEGGTYGGGTVFEIARGSGQITTLASFYGTNGNGWYPQAGVTLDALGNIYGTTLLGGDSNIGTVYEIAKGSGTITTLLSFDGIDGARPQAGVTLDASGDLYSAAYNGGPADAGTVFRLAPAAQLAFTQAPTNAKVGNAFGIQVAVKDTVGSIASDDSTVTLTLDGGTFADGSRAISANAVNGVASFNNLVINAAGSYTLTVTDGTLTSPNPVGVQVAAAPVSVTLAGTSPNPSTANEPLTFTVTVTGAVPDGETVTLVDASNNNAVVATGTLSSDAATLTVPAGTLSIGTHNLVAAYAGDANYAASQSAAYAQIVQVAVPALTGAPVINGDDPNGLYTAAGQSAPGTQRSMVEDIVYTFNEPVTITNANAAFTLAVAGPAGGTLPTTLYAQAVAGSNGTQWAVSLTGQPEGTIASIANGEYSITINPAYVFAAADGVTSMAAGTGRTDNFYRLYGDVFGTENVTALDYNRFKGSLTTYNPMFDNYNTGNITALDYNLFKKDLSINYAGDGFGTSI